MPAVCLLQCPRHIAERKLSVKPNSRTLDQLAASMSLLDDNRGERVQVYDNRFRPTVFGAVYVDGTVEVAKAGA